jgi:hypothetical protein
VYVVSRNLPIFSDFRADIFADSGLFDEIEEQTPLVELMDPGSVNQIPVSLFADLRNSLTLPTDYSS